MKNSENESKPKQKEYKKFNIKSTIQQFENKNNKSISKENINEARVKESFHLNSLITKNISLFTKNPNYKLLAWLIVQLTIFSLFIFAVNIFKTNLIPYINS